MSSPLPAGTAFLSDLGRLGSPTRIPTLLAWAALTAIATACPSTPSSTPTPPPEAQAWTTLCADVIGEDDQCLAEGPLRCVDDVNPPEARCEDCGCPGVLACVDGNNDDAVCASAATREAIRDADFVPPDLADGDYVALYETLLATERADTVADLKATLETLATEDSRRRVVVLGRPPETLQQTESASAFAALQVALGDDDDTLGDATGGAAGAAGDRVDERVTLENARGQGCAGLASAVRTIEIPAAGKIRLAFAVGDLDDASDAMCAFPGSIPRCVLPHRAACLARGGAIPSTVVFVDDAIFIPRLDQALLSTLARINRSQWEQRLDAGVDVVAGHLLDRTPQPRFRFDGGAEVRVVSLANTDDGGAVFVAWRVLEGLRPRALLAFRILWKDGVHRQFLEDHDLTPQECVLSSSSSSSKELVSIACIASDGARFDGVVDTDAGTIRESNLQG